MNKLFCVLAVPVLLIGMEQGSLERKIKDALAGGPGPLSKLGLLQLLAELDTSGGKAISLAGILGDLEWSREYNFRQEARGPQGALTRHIEQLLDYATVVPPRRQLVRDLIQDNDATVLRHIRVFEQCMRQPGQDVFQALGALALAQVRYRGNSYLMYQGARLHAQTLPFGGPLTQDIFEVNLERAHECMLASYRCACSGPLVDADDEFIGDVGYVQMRNGNRANALVNFQSLRNVWPAGDPRNQKLQELLTEAEAPNV